MQKLRIISLSRYRYEVVKRLQALGIIDMRKSKLKLSDDTAMEHFPQISERLVRVDGAIERLSKPKKPGHKIERMLEIGDLLAKCDSTKIISETYELTKEKEKINSNLIELRTALANANPLKGIEVDFSKLRTSLALGFRLIKIDNVELAKLLKRLKHFKITYDHITIPNGNKTSVALILYEKAREEPIAEHISKFSFSNVELNRYITATPTKAIDEIKDQIDRDTSRMHGIEGMLAEISRDSYHELVILKEMLEIEYDRADITNNFKKTDKTFVIEGWVSDKRVGEIEKEVSEITGGAYAMEKIKDKELAPTYTKRNGIFKPFDYLIDFYSPARSDEINPTYIFFIALAIFYGITISDVGYGIVSLIIATLIIRKVNPEGLMGSVARIWQMFSVSVIAFGLLSNQFFGISLGTFKVIQKIDWVNNISSLIVLTVLMGLTMVTIGLALSFVNHYRHGEKKHAIAKIAAIFMLVFGSIAVAGGLFHAFSGPLLIYSAIIAIVGLLVFIVLSGIEAMEVTNIIAHPISFLRLLGFGLASIILASLIDKGFTPNPAAGVLIFILYLVIFIVLHTLNSILSMFEGIVQGTRLNFIEFFSKFYKGGGTKFKPYFFKKNYTE